MEENTAHGVLSKLFPSTVILHCQLMRDRSKGRRGQSSGDQKAAGRPYHSGNLKWMKTALQENMCNSAGGVCLQVSVGGAPVF